MTLTFPAELELPEALRDLGCQVDYWSDRSPKAAEPELPADTEKLVTGILGESNEIVQFIKGLQAAGAEDLRKLAVGLSRLQAEEEDLLTTDMLEDYRKDAIRNALELALREAAVGCHRKRATGGGEDVLREDAVSILRDSGSAAFVGSLIEAADRLSIVDQPAAALSLYTQAVEDAPRPTLHNELGCLFLYRADGVRTVDVYPPSFILLREWDNQGEGELIDAELDKSPTYAGRKEDLVRLAVEAFARSYGHTVHQAVGTEDRSPEELGQVFYEARHALEGLALGLSELEAKQAALASTDFMLWHWALTDEGVPRAEIEFHQRIGYIAGLAEGREIGKQRAEAVAEAEAELQRSKALRKQETADEERIKALAPEIAREIEKARKTISEEADAALQASLAELLGDTWTKLPAEVRRLILEAERLGSLEHTAEFDWVPVAIQYCRAAEGLLKETLGAHLESFLSQHSQKAQTFREDHLPSRGRVKATALTLGQFARLIISARRDALFQKFVQSCSPADPYFLPRLEPTIKKIDRDYHLFSRHYKYGYVGAMAKAEVAKLRAILLGSDVDRRTSFLKDVTEAFSPSD